MSTRTRVAAVAATAAISASLAAPVAAAAPSNPHAGSTILIETSEGTARCTLNSIATRGDTVYGTTAGHCLDENQLGSEPTKITDRNGNLIADKDDIDAGDHYFNGSASPANPDGGLNDFGWFRINIANAAPNAGAISSSPTTGIAPVDDVLEQASGVFSPAQALGDPVPVTDNLVGQIVCKDGSSTGRTCGPVLSVNVASQEVFAFIPAISGDSGAPLTVGGADGKRHIVGTLSNGTPVLFNIFDGTAQQLDKL